MDDFPKWMPCKCGHVMHYQRTRTCKTIDASHEFKCTGKYGCGKRGNYRYINGEFVRAVAGTQPKLSQEQAREVMLSPVAASRLAAQLDVHPSTIKDIRIGRTYAKYTADLRGVEVKREQEYCTNCIHYDKGACSLGFPESRSPSYAANCSVYAKSEGNLALDPSSAAA